jgi:succinate dehydrogenase/fumarate reductase cytochrome b subunit (b558 family)
MKLLKLSSITKKLAVAAFGSFLVLFILVHLGLNLTLLRNDGGEWYRAASNFMGTNYIVKVFEVVLLACVLFHICIASVITVENWLARGKRYKVPSKTKTPFMSKYMIWTGGLIFCFLILHFCNFYFAKYGLVEGKYMVKVEKVQHYFSETVKKAQAGQMDEQQQGELMNRMQATAIFLSEKMDNKEKYVINLSKDEIKQYIGEDFEHYEPDFYAMSKELFANRMYQLIYILAFVVLGFHLSHAVRSMFQTFGLNGDKWDKFIGYFSNSYSVLISLGFILIALFIN